MAGGPRLHDRIPTPARLYRATARRIDSPPQRAAQLLAGELTGLGFDARVAPTEGHPMVVAHHDGDGPHVLFYGHYDVQPVDPLNLWRRDPFDPAIETRADGAKEIVGRGASDDKGEARHFVEG